MKTAVAKTSMRIGLRRRTDILVGVMATTMRDGSDVMTQVRAVGADVAVDPGDAERAAVSHVVVSELAALTADRGLRLADFDDELVGSDVAIVVQVELRAHELQRDALVELQVRGSNDAERLLKNGRRKRLDD